MKTLFLLLGVAAMASPIAPSSCATTVGVRSETPYGNVGLSYELPTKYRK